MTQSNYHLAFRVQVFHSWFENNVCKCLQFKPGTVTKKLQERFDCRMRHNINGFDFYINTQQPVATFLQYITSTTGENYFDFDIETTDHRFISFTELPVNWCGQLIYDTRTIVTYENEIAQLAQNLSVNTGNPLGQLTIRFDDIIKYAGTKFAQFNIQFNARSTQWQYYFINRSALPLTNPGIEKSNITFTGPEKVTIETGEQALFFSSGNELILLSEIPKYKFDLVNYVTVSNGTEKKTSSAKTIFKALPNPDPVQMGIVQLNGTQQASSPMYVYL